MNISIKSLHDVNKMRAVGKLAAKVLEFIEIYVKPGISTGKLDNICYEYITKNQHASSATLGYRGFPKSVCISVNEVVCHGIPSYDKKLKIGDILNIDVSLFKDGFYADTSKMFIVGQSTKLAKRLCQVTKESLDLAIKVVKPGIRLKTIGKVIQSFVEKKNFSIVRDYCGHGIGKKFHEDPQILHYEADDNGIILKSGMAFTIEPMVNAGKHHTFTMNDNWTVKTKDNSLSAQYEHTIVVTDDGCEVITLRKDDELPQVIHHQKL